MQEGWRMAMMPMWPAASWPMTHMQVAAYMHGAAPRPHFRPLPPELTIPGNTEEMLADCATAFSSVLKEYEYWVDDTWVEGTIPAELQGTYFRNGPGIQINSENCQRHAFGE
jgi:hypothetical protein